MIVQMFNWVHILVLLTIPAFIVVSWFFLRNKNNKSKDIYMWTVMGVIIAAYMITFAVDCIMKEEHRGNILKNLPLHLCGINVFLFPLCFALRNKERITGHIALGYMYFIGSPGALLGALMPPSGVSGESLFTYNVIPYFIKHNFVFILPILLVVFNYYKPKARDMLYSIGTLIVLMCFMHGINLAFSAIGGYKVNYFYTRYPDNFILKFFWNYVPVELLYLFTLIVLLVPIFLIYYFFSRIPGYMQNSKSRVPLKPGKPL